jgi:hypothetical protein
MDRKDEKPPSRRMQDWTPEEKLAVVLEAASLSSGELGVFLRSKDSVRSSGRVERAGAHGLRGSPQVAATVTGSKRSRMEHGSALRASRSD